MTNKFIEKVIANHDNGKTTKHGKFEYDIQFHPMAGFCFIIRKDRIFNEWDWYWPITNKHEINNF